MSFESGCLESGIRHRGAILRQTLALDKNNAWCYDQLAWLEATCTNAAIRNGGDAVARATKACDLTQWKNSRFIDTLAAAYGESGDFNRAIAFEEQALRTGTPDDLPRDEVEQRLYLYRQSKPFRESNKPDDSTARRLAL